MKFWRRILASALIGVLLISSLGLTACIGPGKEGGLTLPSAVISPPDIAEAGVLRVGVDSSKAPFAGVSDGKVVGIDVDIAAALAERMGLKLQIVDIKGQEDVSALLNNGTIDVCMRIYDDKNTSFAETKVGPYLVDGTAVFALSTSGAASNFDLNQLYGARIGAQETSLSAWQVGKDYGDDNVLTFATLQEAFDQLSSGAVSYTAADAIAGSFLAMKAGKTQCMAMLGETRGVYIGIATERQELVNRVTDALRSLRDDGSLQVTINKWLGSLSAQFVSSEGAIVSLSSGVGASANATAQAEGDSTVQAAEQSGTEEEQPEE